MVNTICFIGSGLKGGGHERALTNLANYFAQNGYMISIINLFKTEQFYALENNIEVFWAEADRNKHQRLFYALLVLPYLRKTIRKIKPDVIISFGEWLNPYVILSTRGLDIPLFISDRLNPHLRLGFILDISKKILYRKAAGIIAQTQYAANVIRKRTRAVNIKVIPNPLSQIIFPETKKKKQIVTMGRLFKEKGHIYLIEAFSMLNRKDWILSIIGDGPERSGLEEKATKSGIGDNVVFHGHLKDFASILAESEIFVLPSLTEGFPNALLEAMSVPLACISSNCISGPSDIIDHRQNGILVKPGDTEDLAIALNELIEDEQLRGFLAGNAVRIRDKLSVVKIADEYINFFQS